MATETVNDRIRESPLHTWAAGVAGGLLGGIAMGIVLHAGANLMPLIGALYGWPTDLGGWLAHLVHSVVLGLVFVLVVTRWIDTTDATPGVLAIYGVVYAAAIGLLNGGVIVPIALNLMDATALPQPVVPLEGVLGSLLVAFSVGVAHVVYGAILGGIVGRLVLETPVSRARAVDTRG